MAAGEARAAGRHAAGDRLQFSGVHVCVRPAVQLVAKPEVSELHAKTAVRVRRRAVLYDGLRHPAVCGLGVGGVALPRDRVAAAALRRLRCWGAGGAVEQELDPTALVTEATLARLSCTSYWVWVEIKTLNRVRILRGGVVVSGVFAGGLGNFWGLAWFVLWFGNHGAG